MAISEEALRITDRIYKDYGSSTGYLFGLLPDKRHVVEVVVQAAINYLKDEQELKERRNDYGKEFSSI